MSITVHQSDERNRFIDFLLLFKGQLTRAELVERLVIGEATASRLIKSYIKAHPNQVDYLGPRLAYRKANTFQSLYEHDAYSGLNYVATGEVITSYAVPTYGVSIHAIQTKLSPSLIAPITCAIVNQQYASIKYVSTSSGLVTRVVAPHSLFKTSGEWFFRAYDLHSASFRTFKFSRIIKSSILGYIDTDAHQRAKDDSWNQLRCVILSPHPKLTQDQLSAQMFDANTQDKKELFIREACIGFSLRELRVDCSAKQVLNPIEYPFVLSNRNELESVESMMIAPAFNA